MTLPTTGLITMQDVADELGISSSGLSLNDSRVRGLAGISSGAISFADLRGKSANVIAWIELSQIGTIGTAGPYNIDGYQEPQPSNDGSETPREQYGLIDYQINSKNLHITRLASTSYPVENHGRDFVYYQLYFKGDVRSVVSGLSLQYFWAGDYITWTRMVAGSNLTYYPQFNETRWEGSRDITGVPYYPVYYFSILGNASYYFRLYRE